MVTVTECTEIKKSRDGKPIYKITLSDGVTGESFNQMIAPGTSVEQLDVEEHPTYGKKFRMKKAGTGSGGGKKDNVQVELLKHVGFAMSYAKDLCVAGKIDEKQMLPTADLIYNWMQNKAKEQLKTPTT